MKKLLCLLLAFCMMLPASVSALDYQNRLGNEATFETLEEARVNGPASLGGNYASHPVLDGYPEGTTFIYRSADMFGIRAAVRMNTSILVFAEQHFDDKAAAESYIRDLGLIDIADQATGSIILVTPANGETFGDADQKNYYALQTAMCALNARGMINGESVTFAEGAYFGSFAYIYAIGIDGGATFLNNYVANTFDSVSRIAGMLLIGGKVDEIRKVAHFVPVYMVNPDEEVLEKYKAVNAVDAYEVNNNGIAYYNQTLPLQKVVVAEEGKTNAEYVHDAYYDMFIHAMRIPVLKAGLNSAETPYQGYGGDQAPYSLNPRNPVIDGKTEDGIYVVAHKEERFADMKSAENDGEYLQFWYEFLPEEVLDGTAPDHTIPLILCNHGGGDDPWQFVDENGYLELAGKERIALVAGEHQNIGGVRVSGQLFSGGVRHDALPALVEYMLETYPALDPSRVYVTGYSMGAGATISTISGNSSLFAAAVPMAVGPYIMTDEQIAQYDTIDLPIMITTSTYDMAIAIDQETGHISEGYQEYLNRYLGFNEMDPITFDFDTYKISGFRGDRCVYKTLNNEYYNITWYLNNKDGVPMVGLSYTQGLIHALYPQYAGIAWNYMKHFSRDPETKAIIYDEFVD